MFKIIGKNIFCNLTKLNYIVPHFKEESPYQRIISKEKLYWEWWYLTSNIIESGAGVSSHVDCQCKDGF